MNIRIRTNTRESFAALRSQVEKCRELTLGRLARRIRRADLRLERRPRADGRVDHLCELEVDTGSGTPLRLRYRSDNVDKALKATFQRAKAELIRRARAMRRPVGTAAPKVPLPA